MTESQFWQQLKSHLDDEHTHCSRIENTAGTGISDVSACHGGVEVWIEIKVISGRKVYFRNSQKSWIVRRTQAGGRVAILIRKDDAVSLYRGLDVVQLPSTPYKEKAFSVCVDDLPNHLFSGTKPIRWQDFKEKLFGSWE